MRHFPTGVGHTTASWEVSHLAQPRSARGRIVETICVEPIDDLALLEEITLLGDVIAALSERTDPSLGEVDAILDVAAFDTAGASEA